MMRGFLAQYFYSMNGRIQWIQCKLSRYKSLITIPVKSNSRALYVLLSRGVFMLQMNTLPLRELVDGWSKTNIFASNYLKCKTKSVCFDEKHANFRVKHTNS